MFYCFQISDYLLKNDEMWLYEKNIIIHFLKENKAESS